MIGRVISVKSQNTVTVLASRVATHPLYKKTYTQSKKYLVDSRVEVKDGDIVEFISCKPVSKRKAFKINKVLGRSLKEIAEQHLKEKAQEAIAEVMPEKKTEESSAVSPQPEKEIEKKPTKKKGKSRGSTQK